MNMVDIGGRISRLVNADREATITEINHGEQKSVSYETGQLKTRQYFSNL